MACTSRHRSHLSVSVDHWWTNSILGGAFILFYCSTSTCHPPVYLPLSPLSDASQPVTDSKAYHPRRPGDPQTPRASPMGPGFFTRFPTPQGPKTILEISGTLQYYLFVMLSTSPALLNSWSFRATPKNPKSTGLAGIPARVISRVPSCVQA